MNQMSAIAPVQVGDYKARFTTAEFQRIAAAAQEQDIDLELVSGELQRMTPPKSDHFLRQTRLIEDLLRAARSAGLIAAVEAGMELEGDTVTTCDAALLRAPPSANRFLKPADVLLAVEVAQTTLDRDLGPKRLLYAAAAIPEYWVVDGVRSVVHVFSKPEEGEYAGLTLVRFGDPLPVPGTDQTIVIE